MAQVTKSHIPLRRDFSRLPSIIGMPNLIEVQKESYEKFLQMNVEPDQREETGLQAVFKGIFPIEDYSRTTLLDYVKYDILESKFDVQECQDRGMTFAAPLNVTIRLIHLEVDEDTKTKKVREVKEQEVYLGEIPLMTANGTFIDDPAQGPRIQSRTDHPPFLPHRPGSAGWRQGFQNLPAEDHRDAERLQGHWWRPRGCFDRAPEQVPGLVQERIRNGLQGFHLRG